MKWGRWLLAGAALLALGCGDWWERRELGQAVSAYNQALAAAYRTGRLDGLRDVAAEGEVKRVAVLIDLKTSGSLVLESSLDSFELVSVAAAATGGWTVRTRERWTYQDRSTRPGAPVSPRFVADMDMEYDVARQQGRLRVVQGRTLATRYLEPLPAP